MLIISYIFNLQLTNVPIAIKANKIRSIAISFYTYFIFVEEYKIK